MGLIQQMIKNRILTLLLKTKAATLIGKRQNTRLKMNKIRDEEPLVVRWRLHDWTMTQKNEISSLLYKKYQTITLSDEERWNIKFCYVFLYLYNK